jgi:flagellin
MGLRINTNVQSLIAQRQLRINNEAQKDSLERMASGSRINKAADDAAGLAISENMRGQIRSLRQDSRNAQDGISMIQTAEGAMNEVGNILVRFRELAIQASSDTIGDRERGFLDKEVQSLKEELNRIGNATEFNGHKLLTGDGQAYEFQIGVMNDPNSDRIVFNTEHIGVSTSALGVDGMTVGTKDDARNNLDVIDEGIKRVVGSRAELGALQNRLVSTTNNIQIYTENLSTANSRVRDTDVAEESATLTKQNILNQAGVAVLSQANQNNTLALRLINQG